MANVKNQNTLYRFVSLRNPELSKKENQDLRFVFHPLKDTPLSTSSTNFFKAIKDKVETKTKWQALQEFCVTFESLTPPEQPPFSSESQLRSLNEDFYLVADWLAVNKAKLDATSIYTKVNQVTNLSNDDVLVIWDNLFYQTIAQKSFYIKENCIQMLVLYNLKEKIEGLTQANAIANAIKIIKQLADARVVLPTSLFEESETIIEDTSAAKLNETNQKAVITKEILDAQDKIIANFHIEDYQKLIKELEKIQKKYDKEKNAAYAKAYKTHQSVVSPIIASYQKEYNRLKRELCKIPRDANYDPDDFCNQPDLEYPVLPVFEFTYPSITESKFLQDNLSEATVNQLATLLDIAELDSVNDAIEVIKEKIKEHQQEIVSKTVFSKKVMVIGDVVVSESFKRSSQSTIPFVLRFRQLPDDCVVITHDYQAPNSNFVIQSATYQSKKVDGTIKTGTIINTQNAFIAAMDNIETHIGSNGQRLVLDYKIEVTFTNGLVYEYTIPSLMVYYNNIDIITGVFTLKVASPGDSIKIEPSFIPKGFGYRQLGIADYRKVVSHVCCYDAGEVAHIENIMAREFKEKTTEKVYSKEITDSISSETEKESVSDTTSTERFEMQTEIAKLIQEDKQFGAYANLSATYGVVTLDAGANYATNTSKEESNRQAVNQAKELTQRAMERIVTRVRTEKTVRVTESFTDKNSHIFDNRAGAEHVSGVYRFINAIYKNQIYNYGKRLMYEFMIPQPSTLHRLGMKVSNADLNAILLDRPVDPRIAYPTFESIDEGTYKLLASKYGADVKNYPVDNIHIGKSFDYYSKEADLGSAKSDSIQIPDGYFSSMAKFSATAMNSIGAWDAKILVTIGNKPLMTYPPTYPDISSNDEDRIYDMDYISVNKFTNQIPIAISITNFHTCAITINILCNLLPETITNWKKETYQAILDGYNAQVEAYNQQEAAAKAKGVEMLDSNPLFYRQTEQLILKKNAISYLIDNSVTSKRKMGLPMYDENANFTNYQVTLDQDMDNYTSFVKFMEQAFDWNIMSYNFYPFYWGNANDWDDLYQYDSNDPLFRSFMQAGMARVVVTVKPGFEEAVMHYMKFGQIWNGGQMPVIGNPLYLSIVDELKEQEYEVEETWETVVPTNLVALQRSGVALNIDGLPCGDDCKTSTQFEKSIAKLEAPVVKTV